MKRKIALVAQNLRQHKPRGVARVARAFAERLVLSSAFDFFAISSPLLDMGEMMVDAYALNDYLRNVPLDLQEAEAALKLPAPPLRLRPLLRGRIERVARLPSDFETRCEGIGFVPLRGFDAVLSFEAFEDIWDWPVETLPTKAIGVLHDAIPLRINEGPNADAGHFFRVVGKFLHRADRVICNSASTQRDAAAFFPNCADKLTVIHLGHFPPSNDLARQIRQDPNSPVVISMLGDMDRRKNLQTALQAVQFVKEALGRRRVRFDIIGNAGQRADFSGFEARASAHAEIRWLGYLSDKARYEALADSHVFLFPSLWEGFGIPILEAMSTGVLVATTRNSAMPEVAGPHAAYIDDPYAPREIADAVVQLLKLDPSEYVRRAAAAKLWASAFNWEVAGDKILRVLEDVLSAPD